MNNHAKLLSEVLTRVPALPGSVLRAATVGTDPAQLANIAARFDTPTAVLEILAREHTSNGDIANALNLRPALPGAERSYRPETRARVLAAALRSQPRDPDVFRDAIAAFTARRTDTLFDALLGLSPTRFTPEEAFLLLRQSGHLGQRSVSPRGNLAKFVDRLTPTLAVDLLVEHRRWAYLEAVLAHPLPHDLLLKVMGMLTKNAHWATGTDVERATQAITAAFAHLPSRERSQVAEEIISQTATNAPRVVESITEALRTAMNTPPAKAQQWDTRPTETYELPEDLTQFDSDRLAVIAATPDADLLALVVGAALTSGSPSTIVAVANVSLHNRALRAAQLLDLLQALLDLRDDDPRIWSWFEGTADVIGTFGHLGEAVTNLWVEIAPEQVLEVHGWEPFGGPDVGPERIARWVREDDKRTLSKCLPVLGSRKLTPGELLELPLANVSKVLASGPPFISAVNAQTVGRLIDEAMGKDQWPAYEVVLGSLPDNAPLGTLLATVAGVVA